MASIKNLRALVDWFQIQVSDELCVYEIADEMLKIPIEQFLERKGRLEYYTYDRVLEHASVRIHFHSEEIKNEVADNSKMVIMSGQALEFYRSEVLAKEQKSFREFLKQLFTDYSDVFSIKRADPAIDDFNFPSFFTPKQLLKVCEKKRFLYGKSTFYDVYGNETREKGMTLYLKPPSADDRIRIYDKQEKNALDKGVRKKDCPPQIRTEICFRREKAQMFIEKYIHEDIELLDLTRGYLKERVKFYSDPDWKIPLKKWHDFLGKSEPFTLVVPQKRVSLYDKFDWFHFQGGYAVEQAYRFCLENHLLDEKELSEYREYQQREKIFPLELSRELIEIALRNNKPELIDEIKQRTK